MLRPGRRIHASIHDKTRYEAPPVASVLRRVTSFWEWLNTCQEGKRDDAGTKQSVFILLRFCLGNGHTATRRKHACQHMMNQIAATDIGPMSLHGQAILQHYVLVSTEPKITDYIVADGKCDGTMRGKSAHAPEGSCQGQYLSCAALRPSWCGCKHPRKGKETARTTAKLHGYKVCICDRYVC